MTQRWETHPETLQTLSHLLPTSIYLREGLIDLKTVKEVSERLVEHSPILIPDYSTRQYDVYCSRDLGRGYVSRLDAATLETLLQGQFTSPDTLIHLKFQYGNLFALIPRDSVPDSALLTQDVYISVERATGIAFATHIGKYHYHHQLFEYGHLDSKTTSLGKLLQTRRFTSICIATDDNLRLTDLPF